MHPIRHFLTIEKHRHLVFRHCVRAGIPWQGLTHDLSKFSPTEFWRGARYYQGTCSPNDAERRIYGYSLAWMHHKGRNRHHFEFWTDLDPATHRYVPMEMPVRYAAEMFCDRMAASKVYQGKQYTDRHPLDYFLTKNARRLMHPATADRLERWLTILANEGESAAFSAVRDAVRAARKR